MTGATRFVADLAAAMAEQARPAEGMTVSEVSLIVPIEARLTAGASLELSLPRGRIATGFDPPLGRLEIRLVESA